MAALRLGTRGSALALAQAQLVAEALGGAEIVPIKAASSQANLPVAGTAPPSAGDKSRFVKEIEVALLESRVDVGVHSAKDLPGEMPDELRLSGVPVREDPSDGYVGHASSLEEVPEGARIGTSSLRRRAQLLAARPDLEIVELRGNVDTRLRRLSEGDFDAIVVASAGLRRLGREEEIAFRLGSEAMTPAAGQGSLALETRRGDQRAAAAAAEISDRAALVELTAERAAVSKLDATCRTPVGVRACLHDGRLRGDAFVGLPDGSEWVRDTLAGDPDGPVALGGALAERLLAAGAGEILTRAEASEQRAT